MRNAGTVPQNRWNTDWVCARGVGLVGLVGSSWHHLRTLVQLLLESMPTDQAAVRRLDNRAVLEVPGAPALLSP